MMRATNGDGPEETATSPESLGRMVGEVARDVAALVRQEAGLAMAEVARNAADVKKGAVSAGIGAVLVHAGSLAAVAFAALLLAWVLSNWMSGWAAATIAVFMTAGACLAAGWVLLKKGGESLDPRHLVPRRTIASLKEDAEWVRARST